MLSVLLSSCLGSVSILFICLAICPSSVPVSLSDFLSSLFRLSSASILLSVYFCRYPFTFVSLSVSVLSLTSLSVLLCPNSFSVLFPLHLSICLCQFCLVFCTYLSQICLCPLYLSCCLPSSSPVLFTHILYLTIYTSSVSFRFFYISGLTTNWTNLIEEYFGLVL